MKAWDGLLRTDELARVFTPEMIARHFRVIAMGNLLPGQNLEVRPPYVIAFQVAGESQPALIDQLSRTITFFSRSDASTATWTLHPKATRATLDGQDVDGATGGVIIAGNSTLTLTAPDGATNHWRLRRGHSGNLPPP